MKVCRKCLSEKSESLFSRNEALCMECKRLYWKENPQIQQEQNLKRKLKYANDLVYRKKCSYKSHLSKGWTESKVWNRKKILSILSVPNKEFFRDYIVNHFTEGMTLENYGKEKNTWQFDHIIPLNTAKTVEEVEKLFHYSNIQPLWRRDNNHKRFKTD
tara:strand:+ start:2428 stop:2904 length:477 start_codon:yes stop_codon:yes gene_type:complete